METNLTIAEHPLVQHWLGIVRNKDTQQHEFRVAMIELGRWLTYEASRVWLPVKKVTVKTPLADAPAVQVCTTEPLCLVPILRAGLALLEGAQCAVPWTRVYHLGLKRDESTLQASVYLNPLPSRLQPDTRLLILEPMLATGGTMLTVLEMLTHAGAKLENICLVSLVCSPQAMQRLQASYPGLRVFAAALDPKLNEHGYIVPGLGDAGDRTFGTV